MTSKDILERYFKYYKERGHAQIPNVSLIPEGDSTLLFVNAGMFPLVPYLSGEPHPLGKRLMNAQRSLRVDDIENVGNTIRHTTAFHMMGNWSLGDYFKKEQLNWVYKFFIDELGLDPNKLYATVFEGDANAPRDEESISIIKDIFKEYGIEAEVGTRIFTQGAEDNWWQRGDALGELGGPDSEVFYYVGKDGNGMGKNPAENQDDFLEIGNSVFMQYVRTSSGWEELPQKNVDFGGGLERIALVVQGKKDIYETDNFWPLIQKVEELSGKRYGENESVTKSMRILADHIRASMFLAMDGVIPSNKDQGYILRRLLRRMVRVGRNLGLNENASSSLVPEVIKLLSWVYPELPKRVDEITEVFSQEELKFTKTLEKGGKEVEKLLSRTVLSLEDPDFYTKIASLAFDLYQSLGYPPELFMEDLRDKGLNVDRSVFDAMLAEVTHSHQERSRQGAEQKFKGGLADHSDTVVKYHTATHLLQKALKQVVGDDVRQLGSNITNERLRFDFPHEGKLTEDEVQKVEGIISDAVNKKLGVNFVMLPKTSAISSGALYMKNESYPDTVKVYYVGDSLDNAFSKEFCGGPHVSNTSELYPLVIYKQENIGKGTLRIYAKFKDLHSSPASAI